MNAFLNAKEFKLEIDSFEDVLDSDLEMVVQRGTYAEQVFRFAPAGTIHNHIYEKKLKKARRLQDFPGGTDELVQLISEGKVFTFSSLEPMMNRPEYPCSIIEANNPK